VKSTSFVASKEPEPAAPKVRELPEIKDFRHVFWTCPKSQFSMSQKPILQCPKSHFFNVQKAMFYHTKDKETVVRSMFFIDFRKISMYFQWYIQYYSAFY